MSTVEQQEPAAGSSKAPSAADIDINPPTTSQRLNGSSNGSTFNNGNGNSNGNGSNSSKLNCRPGSAFGQREGKDGGKTFALQHKLPKLPVPKLEDAMKRYLRALEGLQVSIWYPRLCCQLQDANDMS